MEATPRMAAARIPNAILDPCGTGFSNLVSFDEAAKIECELTACKAALAKESAWMTDLIANMETIVTQLETVREALAKERDESASWQKAHKVLKGVLDSHETDRREWMAKLETSRANEQRLAAEVEMLRKECSKAGKIMATDADQLTRERAARRELEKALRALLGDPEQGGMEVATNTLIEEALAASRSLDGKDHA